MDNVDFCKIHAEDMGDAMCTWGHGADPTDGQTDPEENGHPDVTHTVRWATLDPFP